MPRDVGSEPKASRPKLQPPPRRPPRRRSERLIVRVRSGLLERNPLMFVSVAFSSSTMNFSPL